jgi:hypothetical protein
MDDLGDGGLEDSVSRIIAVEEENSLVDAHAVLWHGLPRGVLHEVSRVLAHERLARRVRMFSRMQMVDMLDSNQVGDGGIALGVSSGECPDIHIDPRHVTAVASTHSHGLVLSLLWMVDNRRTHTVKLTEALIERGTAHLQLIDIERRLQDSRNTPYTYAPSQRTRIHPVPGR